MPILVDLQESVVVTETEEATTLPPESSPVEIIEIDSIADWSGTTISGKIYGEDKLIVETVSTTNDIISERSLSTVQPEIIVQTELFPHIVGETLVGEGRFYDLQISMRKLMTENIIEIIQKLTEDSATSSTVSEILSTHAQNKSSLESDLKFLNTLYDQINAMYLALDPSDNSDVFSKTIESIRDAGGGQLSPVGQFSTLDGILVCHLGFNEQNVKNFSNSKILGQILHDTYILFEKHSPKLLTTYIENRQTDNDPIVINTQQFRDSTVTYTNSLLSATSNVPVVLGTFEPFDPFSTSDLSTFVSSLPTDEVERTKILISSLSKELRISAGIHNLRTTTLDERYHVDLGITAISNILGTLGDSIVGDAPNEGTFASLIRAVDEEGNSILPFESRVVQDSTLNKKYLPGSVVLVDSILQKGTRYDVGPFSSFSNDVNDVVSAGTDALSKLMNFDDQEEILYYSSVMKKIVSKIANAVNGYVNVKTSSVTSDAKSAIISSAIMSAAYSDIELRSLLVQYLAALNAGNYNNASLEATIDVSPPDIIDTSEDVSTYKPIEEKITDSISSKRTKSSKTSPVIKTGANSTDINIDESPGSESVQGTLESSTVDIADLPVEIENRIRQIYITSTNMFRIANDDIMVIDQIEQGQIGSLFNSGGYAEKFLFKDISDLIDELLYDAAFMCDRDGIAEDTSFMTTQGYTRYSAWTKESIILVILEICLSIFSEFVFVSFLKDDELGITVDVTQNTSSVSTMLSLANEPSQLSGGTERDIYASMTAVSGINSIYSALLTEESTLRDLINVYKAIAKILEDVNSSSLLFFNISGGTNQEKLIRFDQDTQLSEFLTLFTSKQIGNAWEAYDMYLQSLNDSLIPQALLLNDNVLNAIDSFLKSYSFKEPYADTDGSLTKVIFVGLPAGLLDALQYPLFTVGTDTSLESDNRDIITVNIYRKDPTLEDVIFKPLSFTFDMSRFYDENAVIPASLAASDMIENYARLRNIDHDGIGKTQTLTEFSNDNEYNDLTSMQKKEIFSNHVYDFLIKKYTKVVTGLDLFERSFAAKDNLADVPVSEDIKDLFSSIDSASFELLRKVFDNKDAETSINYLLGGDSLFEVLTGKKARIDTSSLINKNVETSTFVSSTSNQVTNVLTPLEQSIVDAQETALPELSAFLNSTTTNVDVVEEIPEDESKNYFNQALTSLLFSYDSYAALTRSPKLFDRIFAIPIDLNHFVIDIDKMSETEVGYELLSNNKFLSLTETSTLPSGEQILKMKRLDKNSIVFSEFFVTVNLGTSA